MSTNRTIGTGRLTRSEGFGLIEEFFRSAMGSAEFYRSKNITEWQFYKWRRLYLEAYPEAGGQKSVPESSKVAFHPVEVRGIPSCMLPSIEISYPSGVTLRLGDGLNDTRLLRELINL